MQSPGIPDTLAHLAVSVDELVPYGTNPRRGDVSLIAESLAVNGQYRPIVVRSGTNEVLAGNHTLLAARELGWQLIAATYVECDDEQARRIVLVDNRANDVAGYDDALLLELLKDAQAAETGLAGTGFTDADLAALLAGAGDAPAALTDVDEPAPLPTKKPFAKEGDVWLLGPHRLLCGDSTDTAAVLDMLDGDRPDAVWTDPPYGVNYVGGTAEKLTIENDGHDDLPELLLGAFQTLAAVCRPGAPVYVAHADTERIVFEQSMLEAGLLVRQNLVWVKSSLVMGRSDYHYRHEPILEGEVAWDDEPEHGPVLYGFTPGGKGRLGRGGPRWFGDNKATTVFEFPKPTRNAEHPTMKPVALIEAQLKNSLPPGGLVLDLFGGSGSTVIAAHHLRSRAALVELDPRYVDAICRRYQEHTGNTPILKRTGKPHNFTRG
jgi:DNA modification methylase